MKNAIGIIISSSGVLGERATSSLQANYLYGVESYAVPFLEVENYIKNGYINAYKWENGKIVECQIDFPKYIDISWSVSRIKRNNEDIYNWIRENTVLLDEQATDKFFLQNRMMRSELSPYAIPTFAFNDYGTLLNMTLAIPKAIVKPRGGTKGAGIMAVDLKDDGVYFSTKEKSGLLTEEAFLEYVGGVGRECDFLFEPRLNLLNAEGKAVDFRCLVARNGTGDWQNVLTYARIGGSNVVSNFSYGGGSLNFAIKVLEQMVGDKAEEKLAEINEVALKTAAFVQSHATVNSCRLGIDICVDRDTNRVYVIEANAKPGVKFVGPWPLALVLAQYYKYVLENGAFSDYKK
ncbi:MAG: YheC/YheD family protein [Clostridia bacterium]|nr:YheC/YheD family protein [Clostridia bacterium]